MSGSKISAGERSRLIRAARSAAKRAYAPYSKVWVGSAVLTKTGNIHTGCNVENASYGLTICAERAAIFSAVAQEGGDKLKIRAIAVFKKSGSPLSPCGACRQVIFEFGPDAVVIFQGAEGLEEMPINRLLPEAFCL